MLDATVNELVDHLRDRFPANHNYSKKELNDAPEMPAPIAHYLLQTVDHRVTGHLHRISTDPWIDETRTAVRQSLEQVEHALKEGAHIPADEWSDALTEAANNIVAYLVDPVAELGEFVFRERSPLPVADVRERMAYFSPYSYLHSVFAAYAKRKSLDTIDRDRFREVLERIDRQMVADYTVEKWERLFQPLFEVLGSISPGADEPRVRVEFIRRLAANKQFDALRRRLERTDNDRLSLADTRRLIAAALDTSPSSSTEPSPPAKSEPRQQREVDRPQPRWKQFQQGTRTRSASRSPGPESRPSKPKDSADSSGQPLWQRFQSAGRSHEDRSQGQQSSRDADRRTSPLPSETTETPDAQPASDSLEALERSVIGVIPGDQRERFVRQLFSGSRQAYEEILGELREVNSWEQASSLIAKKVFLPHQVNIYSEPAVTFTDLVEARFRQASVR